MGAHREEIKELHRWRRELGLPDDGETTRQVALHVHLTSRRRPDWREALARERRERAGRPHPLLDVALGNHQRLLGEEEARDVPRLARVRLHREAVSRLRAALREHRGTTLPFLPDDLLPPWWVESRRDHPESVAARHELGLVFRRTVLRADAAGPVEAPFLTTTAGAGEACGVRVRGKGVRALTLRLEHLSGGRREVVGEWEVADVGEGDLALTFARRGLDDAPGDVEVMATLRVGELSAARGRTVPGPRVPTEAVVHEGAVPPSSPTALLALHLLPPGRPEGPVRESVLVSADWSP